MKHIENIYPEIITKNMKDSIKLSNISNISPINDYKINFKKINSSKKHTINIKTDVPNGTFFFNSNIGESNQNHLFEFHPLLLKIEFKNNQINIETKIIKNKRYYKIKNEKPVFQIYEKQNKKFSLTNILSIFDPKSAPICNIIVNKNSNGEFVSYGEAGAWNLKYNDFENGTITTISTPHGLIINNKYTFITTHQYLIKKGCYYSINNGQKIKYFKLNKQNSHIHDFYETKHYIIINLSIMTFSGSLFSFLISPSFTSSVDMKKTTNNIYLFVNKVTFEIIKVFEIENDNVYVGHQEYAFEINPHKVVIYRQVSKNIDKSPYVLASLENLKKRKPKFGKQILEKLTFDLNKKKVECQRYNFGSGFMCINQNFLKKQLKYLYFNHMIFSNNTEAIICLDIQNNMEIGAWHKNGFYVSEPQIIPIDKNSLNEEKVKIVFITINRTTNDSYLIICDYRMKQINEINLNIKLNMGIHTNFFF